MCCAIVVTPLVVAAFTLLDIAIASWISTILAMSILFVSGTYFGRHGRRNPLIKGIRMVVFGMVAFALGFLIHALI